MPPVRVRVLLMAHRTPQDLLHPQPCASSPASPTSFTLVQPHQLHPTSASLKALLSLSGTFHPRVPPTWCLQVIFSGGPLCIPGHSISIPTSPDLLPPELITVSFPLCLTHHIHLSRIAPGGQGDQVTHLAEVTRSWLSRRSTRAWHRGGVPCMRV